MSQEIKKICFLLGGNKLSGAEKRIIITAINLANDDMYKVKLITSQDLREEFLKSELAKLETSKIKWIKRKRIKANNRYIRGISNLIKDTILNLFQLPFFGSYIHIVLFNNPTLLSTIPHRLIGNSKYFYEITSPDVAHSKATKNLIKYEFLSDKLICVSASVEDRLLNIKPQKAYTRKQPLAYTSGDNDDITKQNLVVFAHRLIKRKNPMLAVEAFKILATKYPQWCFCICGDGIMEKVVNQTVTAAGIPNLLYKGYVYDMDQLMKRSKIFVSLIEPDNYPSQSIFNAMANGNALIVSNTGSSKEKFIQDNGYAVEPTINAVVDGVEKIIEEKETCHFSKNSLNLFKKKYRPELYFEENKNIYN